MNKTTYKWYLSVDDGETLQRVYPIYKGDLSLDYELETGQYFHRAKLSGKIDFVGADYDWIMTQSFESLYHLYIKISQDRGATYSDYWHGIFVRTDCDVNIDDKKIVVQPQVYDRYTKVLDGMEREYDLIRDLNPNRTSIESTKRGYWQLYIPYREQCANIYDGDVIMEDVENELSIDQIEGLHAQYNLRFAQQLVYARVINSADAQGHFPEIDCEGTYVGYVLPDNPSYSDRVDEWHCWLKHTTKPYHIEITGWVGSVGEELTMAILWDEDNNALYTSYTQIAPDLEPAQAYLLHSTYTGMIGRVGLDVNTITVYGRYICNTPENSVMVRGVSVAVSDKPITGDLTSTGLNYTRVFPCGKNIYTQGNIFISGRSTTTPSKWGDNDGVYWLPPTDDAEYLPLYQRDWVQGVSYWVLPLQASVGDAVQTKYYIPDMFAINDVIAALLAKIDASITHQGTTAYSEFLYGINPISNLAQRLYITPKSNAIVSEYSMAAKKGTITLKMVLDMLCKVFRCYWYIDEENRLRIEHYKWWAQGKSYISNAWQIGADLTTLQNTRNGKAWGFGKNSYTYDKQDMPERYVFKWMDDVSSAFDGEPIVLQSPLVEQDRKEEQSISNFTTDLGSMLISGTEVSKDGFALIGTRSKNAWLYNNRILDITGASQYSIAIYGGTDFYNVTLKVAATNTSGQSQQIEYGIAQEVNGVIEYNKRGEIASATTAVNSTITIASPSRDFYLYFRNADQNPDYNCSVTIKEILGGIEEIPVVIKSESYHYPITDNYPYIGSQTVSQDETAIEVTIPDYLQYVASTPLTDNYIFLTFNVECTNGYIDVTAITGSGTAITYTPHYTTGEQSVSVPANIAKVQFKYHLNSGESTGTYNIAVNSITFNSEMQAGMVNYYLSFQYILPTYWAYGLPVPQASFNGKPAVITTLMAKSKTQTAKLPIGDSSDPDTEKEVKTFCGIGMIYKMSVPLSSRVATLTLKQDMYE